LRGVTARNSSSTGEGSHRLHVVAALHSYSVRRTVQQFFSGLLCCPYSFELVILDEYASAVVVQVSLHTRHSDVGGKAVYPVLLQHP
jgi:hypothetical protein